MIAVDTNVLVRLLVDEPSQPEQVTAARALVADAGAVHLPLVVLVELVWVIETSYGVDKSTVIEVLDHLTTNEAFQLEAPMRCRHALAIFRAANADFSDCLILAGCTELGLSLHTFDKRLARLEGAHGVLCSDPH